MINAGRRSVLKAKLTINDITLMAGVSKTTVSFVLNNRKVSASKHGKRCFPALTTVALDKDTLGTYAVDLLIQLINGENPKSITISSKNLVIRESVAKRG